MTFMQVEFPMSAYEPKHHSHSVPWLDFENQKAVAAAVVRQLSGRHYGCLACQKSTVAALHTIYSLGTLQYTMYLTKKHDSEARVKYVCICPDQETLRMRSIFKF